jgi:hypothetical protein
VLAPGRVTAATQSFLVHGQFQLIRSAHCRCGDPAVGQPPAKRHLPAIVLRAEQPNSTRLLITKQEHQHRLGRPNGGLEFQLGVGQLLTVSHE